MEQVLEATGRLLVTAHFLTDRPVWKKQLIKSHEIGSKFVFCDEVLLWNLCWGSLCFRHSCLRFTMLLITYFSSPHHHSLQKRELSFSLFCKESVGLKLISFKWGGGQNLKIADLSKSMQMAFNDRFGYLENVGGYLGVCGHERVVDSLDCFNLLPTTSVGRPE